MKLTTKTLRRLIQEELKRELLSEGDLPREHGQRLEQAMQRALSKAGLSNIKVTPGTGNSYGIPHAEATATNVTIPHGVLATSGGDRIIENLTFIISTSAMYGAVTATSVSRVPDDPGKIPMQIVLKNGSLVHRYIEGKGMAQTMKHKQPIPPQPPEYGEALNAALESAGKTIGHWKYGQSPSKGFTAEELFSGAAQDKINAFVDAFTSAFIAAERAGNAAGGSQETEPESPGDMPPSPEDKEEQGFFGRMASKAKGALGLNEQILKREVQHVLNEVLREKKRKKLNESKRKRTKRTIKAKRAQRK